MGTFIVLAKYLKTKEEDMELRDSRDLGTFQSMNQKWVYKRQGLSAEEVFRVVEYTASKTLLETYEGTEILCNEAFEEVYKKWSQARKDTDYESPKNEEINHTDENDSEEDDD